MFIFSLTTQVPNQDVSNDDHTQTHTYMPPNVHYTTKACM
jgi:hypothetical protein